MTDNPGYQEREPQGSPESPVYRKVAEELGWATQTYMVVVDEGWAESILCERMYDWSADWLIEQLQGKPYGIRVPQAPGSALRQWAETDDD